ncbi:hypothetical protein [Aeromonas caviae]|uniref:hypothetical protein n=1 Tax=Aeromonas caviae TaxID=648 RepID=UPI000FE3C177|nr:hypothetical protein [Aeromonas caviae]
MNEYLLIGATIIASLGGSGAIILGLSNYLGKLWAERLMATERANHEQKLERLRIQLQKENQLHLAELNNDLEIYKQTHLREHSDKFVIYRATIDLVAIMLSKVEMIVLKHKRELSPEEKEKFEKKD